MAFGAPCEHKLHVVPTFQVEKYDARWLCSIAFRRNYKNLISTTNLPYIVDYDNLNIDLVEDNLTYETNNTIINSRMHTHEMPQHGVSKNSEHQRSSSSINFAELPRVPHELVRYVINDATLSRFFYKHIVKWT